jgi:cupin fold WbuC family metalloprotein
MGHTDLNNRNSEAGAHLRTFSADFLETLARNGSAAPRGRQHWNVHTNYSDPCQRLFNAIGETSYIRPHRHSLDPKAECLVAVRGLFAIVHFDDAGNIQEIQRFGTERFGAAEEVSVGVEVPPQAWHSVLALVPGAILLELKAGPFDPDAAKELAPWAPDEGTLEGAAYLKALRAEVKQTIDTAEYA